MNAHQDRRQRGDKAEAIALDYLQNNGLRLVELNYTCRFGEIDLIMDDEKVVVFVEVRYRSSQGMISALESIDDRKQQKIVKVAQHYLLTHPKLANQVCRFDALGLSGSLDQPKIEWVPAAFELS